MKTQIVYLKFVGEDGREIQMPAAEKEKWYKKFGALFAVLGLVAVGIVIGISGGGSGGFRIKSINIENLVPQNRMS